MGFREQLQRPQKRTRLLALALGLGIVAVLPVPTPQASTAWNLWVLSFWAFSLLLSWLVWFRPSSLFAVWLLSVAAGLGAGLREHIVLPGLLLGIWGAWYLMRTAREGPLEERGTENLGKKPGTPGLESVLVALVAVSTLFSAPLCFAQATGSATTPEGIVDTPVAELPTLPMSGETTPAAKASEEKSPTKPEKAPESETPKSFLPKDIDKPLAPPKVKARKADFPRPKDNPQPAPKKVEPIKELVPKYMTGYALKDLSSCTAVDRVPWKFRPDHRKSRLLMKDVLRHQDDTHFDSWEVYQVMDGDGMVTYVFRHALSDGRFESLVVKDSLFHRVLDTKDGPKIMEQQDLKVLIGRPAITFYHADGSTLSYSPSAAGKSLLSIQPFQEGGRPLAPLYIRGNFCDRPEDDEDSDLFTKKVNAAREGAPSNGASGAAGAKK